MPLESGTRLGPYEILAPLGAGGMGEVFRARDTRLGREVAVKVLPAELSSDADRLLRFEREARAAAALEHPAILNVHDVGTQDGRPYVVSELLEGETLRELLGGQGRLPPRKALEIAAHMASGLGAAHDKGIVHRDLKPENLFVTSDGRVKILDFGLARLLRPDDAAASGTDSPTQTRHTDPGSVVGTAGYMSPEQVRGRAVDHRSDLFAFGVVFYEMLTGRRAFQGPSSVETMSAILKEDPLDRLEPGTLTPALERIVRHCLEKNPGERFQSAHDLAFDLQALSGVSGESRARVPVGHSRRLALSLAALSALAVAGAAGYYAGRRTSVSPPDFRVLTFRRGSVGSARFSPDGRTVFYTAKWGERMGLFSAALDSPEPRPLEPAGQLVGTAAGEVAILLPREGGNTLARVPLGGGTPREVHDGITTADWARSGEFAVVRQEGGRDRVEFPPGHTVYETENEIYQVRVSPSGRYVALEEGVRNYSDTWVVVTDVGGRQVFRSGPWRGGSGPVWAPGEKELWYSGVVVGTDHEGLWAIDLKGQRRIRLRIPGPLSIFDAAPDGRALISAGSLGTEMVVLPPGETRERNLTWLGRSVVTDLSADGRLVLFEDGAFVKQAPYAFLGPTDGRAPVQLARGSPATLSPDGRFVIVLTGALDAPTMSKRGGLAIVPTGPGPTRSLPSGPIETYNDAFWFPDGRQVLIRANEKGRPLRLFVQDLEGGMPRAITPEGISTDHPTLTRDGAAVLAGGLEENALFKLFPVAGGEPRTLPGLRAGDVPLRYDPEGRYLYVREPTPRDAARALVARLDVKTGRREVWKDLRPADPAGVSEIQPWIRIADDGRAYAYSYERELSNLYLVNGLR